MKRVREPTPEMILEGLEPICNEAEGRTHVGLGEAFAQSLRAALSAADLVDAREVEAELFHGHSRLMRENAGYADALLRIANWRADNVEHWREIARAALSQQPREDASE